MVDMRPMQRQGVRQVGQIAQRAVMALAMLIGLATMAAAVSASPSRSAEPPHAVAFVLQTVGPEASRTCCDDLGGACAGAHGDACGYACGSSCCSQAFAAAGALISAPQMAEVLVDRATDQVSSTDIQPIFHPPRLSYPSA
jgi:hypothetical protein